MGIGDEEVFEVERGDKREARFRGDPGGEYFGEEEVVVGRFGVDGREINDHIDPLLPLLQIHWCESFCMRRNVAGELDPEIFRPINRIVR